MHKTDPKPATMPTRRLALFSGGAILGGLLTPAIANAVAPDQAAPSPDAELIEACAEAARLEAQRQNIDDGIGDISDDACDECLDAWWATFERLEGLRATTLGGIRAKATAARLAVRARIIEGPDYTMEDAEMHERLAVALCDDIDAILTKGSAA